MLYWIGRTLFQIIFKTVFRLKVSGKENLPLCGFIIASNHNSLIDPPLVGASLERGVYFLAKKELFDIPIFGNIIKMTHAFPVDRNTPGADFFKKALKLLKSRKILLIFPEGTRKSISGIGHSAKKINRGVAMLAHKSGVPVVPSKIYNNKNLWGLPRLRYVIGHPIHFPLPPDKKASSNDYLKFSEIITDKIKFNL